MLLKEAIWLKLNVHWIYSAIRVKPGVKSRGKFKTFSIDDFELEYSGLRPTKTYGTRWISHRLNVLHKFYDKFEVFVLHLESLIREATTTEKSTLEGVRWKVVSSSVIINAALFSYIGTCERSQHCITK